MPFRLLFSKFVNKLFKGFLIPYEENLKIRKFKIMSFEKESNSHSRAILIRLSTQARNTYYKLMAAIKQDNQNNNQRIPKKCELIDAHVFSRFIGNQKCIGADLLWGDEWKSDG